MKSANAVYQGDLAFRFYDCFAAERRLRQLLQGSRLPELIGVRDCPAAAGLIHFLRGITAPGTCRSSSVPIRRVRVWTLGLALKFVRMWSRALVICNGARGSVLQTARLYFVQGLRKCLIFLGLERASGLAQEMRQLSGHLNA
ncbi:hypothetical protein HNO86_27275 [Pseudomonas sp. C1C7]|uniref:hypothetical protein n=1 Tax=Pseudomonas sp. C1C7 TaxID=2735272 RepID=UPI001586D233|nr:hypothetical protein [Pseudomonas sp. C1C7]NUT78747.1 hypothetical protein [Pseudomonas sp. C1C7]